ncbi:hypothetical protein GCM10022243_19730 [Saccharothrix violaceirubra]|uniref:Amino acid adenylation domain-containing protein n=1 Tax=Saccharothrix violaceirubra TaxID=413306 RepID=A0A7W7T241_9PSEU|nr:non-ribosomal peptide synthetase [Saccharothrix violaceirubra]MBB4965121.1 amino acid adenylation domain-containing protein [Saccharothrix violaceirubra]
MSEIVHELVTAQDPDRVAVVGGPVTSTYRDLDRRAGLLAARLVDLGVRVGDGVGVFLPRSVDLVVAVLAVLKAGGGYVPLDPDYPAARVSVMLDAVRAPVVITDATLADRLSAYPGRVVRVEDPLPVVDPPVVAVRPDDVAYTMFTSGSTGVPKGVAVRHRGIVRLVRDPGVVRLGPDEVVLHLSSPSFDASTFDLWGALANGGRLVVAPAGRPSVGEIADLIRSHGITTVFFPTGLFHLMVDERLADLAGVRQVVVGGDVLSSDHAHRFVTALPGVRLVNGYGPTEMTTFTTFHEVGPDQSPDVPVPIGRPLARTRVVVLDESLSPATTGQLYAGGPGLARGYLDPALTASRFVPDPDVPGERLYATGDLVRVREDGVLEFLGRIDRQVKKRGYRVEPAEVELALRADPDVRDAAVVLDGDTADTRRLIAYVVAETAAGVRARIGSVLPDYLVPDVWITVSTLPLTVNGKVDRAALPSPDLGTTPSSSAGLSADEAALAEIWREILALTEVGRHDDFFDLGGHSLLANRIVSRVRRRFGVDVPLSAVFDHPTVAGFAVLLRR